MSAQGVQLAFYRAEDIDWDAEPLAKLAEIEDEDSRAVLAALERRGASFAGALSGLTTRRPVIDVLLELAAAGWVRSDSFAPLRALLVMQESKGLTPCQMERTRNMAAQAGRWELTRPQKEQPDEALLNRDFDERRIVCRETARRLSWTRALELLRVWEYTGKARRGYFVAGLPGIQFIRQEDYAGVTAGLDAKDGEAVWLHATDPLQAWGNLLPHVEERSFLCVPGTVVCLIDGRVAAVAGLRMDEALRVAKGSVKVLRIEVL